jgi:hypothetical protein
MVNANDEKKALNAVLTALGVVRACVIDDEFEPEFASAIASSFAATANGKGADVAQLWEVGHWDNADDDEDRDAAEAHWKGLEYNERRKLVKNLNDLAGTAIDEDLRYFGNVWPNHLKFSQLHPREFEHAAESILRKANGPVLLFVDLDFGEEGRRGGVDILKKLPGMDLQHPPVCVVLTNNADATRESELALWEQLVAECGLRQSAAVVISKKILGDPSSAVRELRRAFLNFLTPQILSWATKVSQAALSATEAKLRNIDGDVLDAIMLRSSREEGVLPSETLFRLIGVEYEIVRADVTTQSQWKDSFNALAEKLTALGKIQDQGQPTLSKRVKELRHQELYRRSLSLGQDELPISLGDLWEVELEDGSKHTFVLLGQPCDLVLRKNGKRAATWTILVEFSPTAPVQTQRDAAFELPCFDSNTYQSHWVNLKKARPADPDVLDAVALFGGKLEFSKLQDKVAKGHIHHSVATRAKLLAENYKAAANREAFADERLRVFVGPGERAKLLRTEAEVNFHCVRLARLESHTARALLQRFAHYTARPGLPHDFAREFSKDLESTG